MPRFMVMFPAERFGQFCGAQALVRSGSVMLGGLLAGVYIDSVRKFFAPDGLTAYRFVYLWILVFMLIAYVFHYRAYRYWKRMGGELGTAPLQRFSYSDLPESAVSGVDRKLLIIPTIGFLSYLGAALFFIYYFQLLVPDSRNVAIFSILSALLLGLFAAYIRFLRFLERP